MSIHIGIKCKHNKLPQFVHRRVWLIFTGSSFWSRLYGWTCIFPVNIYLFRTYWCIQQYNRWLLFGNSQRDTKCKITLREYIISLPSLVTSGYEFDFHCNSSQDGALHTCTVGVPTVSSAKGYLLATN